LSVPLALVGQAISRLSSNMRKFLSLQFLLILLCTYGAAASKPHILSFGKWQSAKYMVGVSEDKPVEMKVRGLFVDAKLKEYTVGLPHDITERLFVVRRAFHLNDNLPEDKTLAPHWLWQRGGWLLVDRVSGRVSPLSLPDFDTYSSNATWYRDYVAYCGVSEDGVKLSAVVMQVGRRKPVFRKALGKADLKDIPDSACDGPVWQRQPARVSFIQKDGQRLVFSIRTRTLDIIDESDDEDEANN
jgi:hypothetical protein